MSSFPPDDPWITRQDMMPSPEKLHALGTVTFRWNICEVMLSALFRDISGLSAEVAWVMTKDMGDVTICDKIRELMTLKNFAPNKLDRIQYCMNLYYVNRLNRNQLTHFSFDFDRGMLSWSTTFARKSKTSMKPQVFPNSLADIRKVADEIAELRGYMTSLSIFIHGEDTEPLFALLEKPLLPEKLWKPPPQVRPERKRPPQS